MAEPRLVTCPARVWRVGRSPEPMRFSEIDPVDASIKAGNRFDIPGGGVLYAASTPEGAFAETLSRLRPTARMRQLPREVGEHFMEPGAVAADWRTKRQLVEFELSEPLPFLDVDDPETHTFLTTEMASILELYEVEVLDVAIVRSDHRLLTRAIAQWAFTAVNGDGDLCYSGIRYGSRLGNYECWAIFEGSELGLVRAHSIEKSNTHLKRIAQTFDLTIH